MTMKPTLATLFILVLAGSGAHASPLSFDAVLRGVDYVSAGAGGLRGTGTTDLTVSGLSAPPSQVYLYWHGPTNDDADGPLGTVTFAGTQVVGEHIGTSDDNFWGRANSQAYRADVTALVTGDGTYTLEDVAPNDGNGASLVAIFDDGNDSNNRDIVTFKGNDANFANPFDPLGWFFGANNIEYSGGSAFVEFHVSDGQNFGPFDDSPLLLNGVVLADGGTFQGASTPFNPATTVTNGSLWDIVRFDITGFLVPGNNNLLFTLGATNDALSLVFAAIDLPAGSTDVIDPIDPIAPIPIPATGLLLLSACCGFALSRRKKAAKG
jgi:hypothetical protein